MSDKFTWITSAPYTAANANTAGTISLDDMVKLAKQLKPAKRERIYMNPADFYGVAFPAGSLVSGIPVVLSDAVQIGTAHSIAEPPLSTIDFRFEYSAKRRPELPIGELMRQSLPKAAFSKWVRRRRACRQWLRLYLFDLHGTLGARGKRKLRNLTKRVWVRDWEPRKL